MTLAKEWGRLQTTVYCVAFGFIETRLTVADSDEGAVAHIEGREIKVGMNREIKQTMESIIPLGRVGTPEDAAGAIYLFCQPKSDYVTDRPSCAAAASQASDHPRPRSACHPDAATRGAALRMSRRGNSVLALPWLIARRSSAVRPPYASNLAVKEAPMLALAYG